MHYSVSALRANLYKVIDGVIKTGVPVEVLRHGRRVKIVSAKPPDKISTVTEKPDLLTGNPDDIVHLDWSDAWRP